MGFGFEHAMSDDKLEIGKEDPISLKSIVDQYQDLVLNTCYYMLHNRQDAEDVSQEVFIQVYKSIDSFRHEAKLSTWLYRIAINRSLNFIRDHRKSKLLLAVGFLFGDEPGQLIEISAPDSCRPDIALEDQETRQVIQKALDSLPAKQRAAFILHKYERLSHQETAEILNCSVSSVESLIHRARTGLQKRLISFVKEKQ